MIIAVPTFAVAFRGIAVYVNKELKKKELSTDTEDYMRLEYIDENEKTYVELKK